MSCPNCETLRQRAESAEARIASVSGVTREELVRRTREECAKLVEAALFDAGREPARLIRAPSVIILPGRAGYVVMSDRLHARLRRAEERERTAATVDEREAATREAVEIWEAIEAHEAEGRERGEEDEHERQLEESAPWGRE